MAADNKGIFITFSMKSGKAAVSEGTFQALGWPELVVLLVQPGKKRLAFLGGSREEKEKSGIVWSKAEDWIPFRRANVHTLGKIYRLGGWDPDKDYRVPGRPGEKRRGTVFFLDCAEDTTEGPYQAATDGLLPD